MYMYVYVCMYMYIYIYCSIMYIYIYREREIMYVCMLPSSRVASSARGRRARRVSRLTRGHARRETSIPEVRFNRIVEFALQ